MAAGNSSAAVLKLNGRMVDDLLSLWRERGRMGILATVRPQPGGVPCTSFPLPNIGLFDRIANPHRPNDESGSEPAVPGINHVISMVYGDHSLPSSSSII